MSTPPRYIPERTIDSLFAIELVRHDPYALVWSPTNTAGAEDHRVFSAGGRMTIFETKAVTRSPSGDWVAPVTLPQLRTYASLGLPVYYVLLSRPTDPRAPHWRECDVCGRWCKACCRDERSWGLLEPHVRASDERLLLQPWFCHWAWVIEAKELEAFYAVTVPDPTPSGAEVWSVSAGKESLTIQGWLNATRLCHFLQKPLAARSTVLAKDDERLGRLSEILTDVPGNDSEATPPVFVLSRAD